MPITLTSMPPYAKAMTWSVLREYKQGVRMSSLLGRVGCWLGLLSLAACVYDHRITQAIMDRRRRAREAQGARIAPAPSVRPVRYTGRVRFYVSDEYRAQHTQWRQPLEDLVDAASSIVGPTFAFRFSSVEVREWSPRCAQAELAACLRELAEHDAGEPGLWIVGVLGDTPRYTATFEHLGMAQLLSSHVLLRDVSDLAERDAIEQAFATHTPGDRAEIYTRRKRHKRLAVFLHEWAHTLGGLHSNDAQDLLHPSYDDRMTSFGNANAGLIEASLQGRFAGDDKVLLAYVENVDAARFVGREHADLLTLLRDRAPQAAAPQAAAPQATTSRATAPQAIGSAGAAPPAARSSAVAISLAQVAAQAESAPPGGLSADDAKIYQASERASQQGDPALAWHSLRPLVDRYPSSAQVQHSACTLSMQLGDMAAAQQACTRYQKLQQPASVAR